MHSFSREKKLLIQSNLIANVKVLRHFQGSQVRLHNIDLSTSLHWRLKRVNHQGFYFLESKEMGSIRSIGVKVNTTCTI
jgi:hypothetical protein